MAKLIEKNGKSMIVTENEIDLSDLEKKIKITQDQIDNIDYNRKGLKQRREILVNKLSQLNAILDSIPKNKAGSIDPALSESQLLPVE